MASANTRQRVRSAGTIIAAIVLSALMVWIGVMQLTKPLPTFESDNASSQCSESEITRQTHIARKEIAVSVYNAGARKGFAGTTQERLERAGFRVGELGNAPKGTPKLRNSIVYTSSDDLAPARLVARVLGSGASVRETDEDYGPGVDVFVGSAQKGLDKKAPKRIKLDEPIETCVRVD